MRFIETVLRWFAVFFMCGGVAVLAAVVEPRPAEVVKVEPVPAQEFLAVPHFPLEPTEDGWSQIICVRQRTRVGAVGELE